MYTVHVACKKISCHRNRTAKWVTRTHRRSGHMWPPLLYKEKNFCSAKGGQCVPLVIYSEYFAYKLREKSNSFSCDRYLYLKCYKAQKALCRAYASHLPCGNVLMRRRKCESLGKLFWVLSVSYKWNVVFWMKCWQEKWMILLDRNLVKHK